jgi:hypothetical protein
MTSREEPQRRFEGPLDVTIRSVLRESMADVTPPSGVWEQISERLIQQVSMDMRRAGWRRGFRLAVKAAALWLLDAATDPPAEFAHCCSPRPGEMREKDYLYLLIYQCDLPMLLGQAV